MTAAAVEPGHDRWGEGPQSHPESHDSGSEHGIGPHSRPMEAAAGP